MSLTREQVVQGVKGIVSEERVITDKHILKESSVDRFRKYEFISGVYTQHIPAAIVKPENTEQVAEVLKYCNENGINVIPRTGFSALEQMLESVKENHIVLDGSGMNKIIKIDECNMQVTCQCGVNLQELDEILQAKGYTTAHSPQSKPLAQMGGLVATRSIGQFSTLYGGIEDMVVGLEAVFPNGEITRIKNVPRRAAGPDIRHVIIGNEGALCYITEVTVKIFKYMPENNLFYGYTLDSMKTGFEILRQVMVEGYKPSVARLYDAADAQGHFSHFANDECVLVFMAEGPKGIAEATGAGIEAVVKQYPECQKVDSQLIEDWFARLNWGLEQVEQERIEISETKNMGFTTEVAGCWDCIHEIYTRSIERVKNEIPDITWMGGHSSHSYLNGTNMYFVYYYDVNCAPEEEIHKYHNPINKIIVEEALKAGGTMVHHHGVGKARAPWIKEEYGSSFYILKTLKNAFDPNNIMNAGNIIPVDFLK
ncbi:FAD-binding oxidoreductase [Fodinisporobacter ferrooxydans]|uniref:FAD-binding oxidoreductase n=1 Tax=Fodinisporobacter ferrooxydans TaxID=2901836 RepID=A0ABY4CHR0_9BACL|nr:FAD-binding oxidoreductase [Alicyclobacillaceae bacterium MYW30-H2]